NSVDTFAVETEHAVEAAELHALHARIHVGQAFEHANIEPDFIIELAAHEPFEKTNAASGSRIFGLCESKGEQGCRCLINWYEEDVQAPTNPALLACFWLLPPVVV